jgi:hypothetical protein
LILGPIEPFVKRPLELLDEGRQAPDAIDHSSREPANLCGVQEIEARTALR